LTKPVAVNTGLALPRSLWWKAPRRFVHHCTQTYVLTTVFLLLCISIVISVFLYACLSARISKNHSSTFSQILPNFLYILPVAVARFFADGNAVSYVLPVLWMTSCFHIMDGIGSNQRRRVCFVQFAGWRHQSDVKQRCLVEMVRWRYRGRSLPFPTTACWRCILTYVFT